MLQSKKTVVLLSVSILLFIIISLLYSFSYFDSDTYIAKNGNLNLSNWNPEVDDIVKLKGEWLFYPGELITPNQDDDVFQSYQSIQQMIPVPKRWDDYIADDSSPFGVGTYRLLIHVPKDDRYGLKINTIRNANKVFINGFEVGNSGFPSKDEKEYQYDYKKYVSLAESKEQLVEVVIQVANKEYIRGGIVQAIDFGTSEDILAKQGFSRWIEAFLISGYLLFALIYFGFYAQQKLSYLLYFILFCIFQAIYVSTVNERWLFIIFPKIMPAEQFSIQTTAALLMSLFFMFFLSNFFKITMSKKIITFLSSLVIIDILLFGVIGQLLGISEHFLLFNSQLLILFTIFLCILYTIILLLKAFLKEKEEYGYIFIVTLCYISYEFLLIMEFFFEIEISNSTLFLFLVMVFSLSLLISHRFQKSLIKVEQLSADLLLHDKLKDDFLAKTSHELSTPLHGIINLSQTLIEGVEGPLRKSQQESLLLIHTVGKRLAKIVEDLLFVSNIKEGKMRLTPEATSVDLVEEVLVEMSYLLLSTKQVQLVNNVPKDLPSIYVDEQKLRQVLFNLIYNAIKYTERGTITISAYCEKEQMVISVTDTGKGIPKEHIDHIFTSFYQVENIEESTTNKRGLGLGLSITKNIVEESGGRIWVTSEVGKGSTFTFTIPLATKEQLQVQQHVVNENQQKKGAQQNFKPITKLFSTSVIGSKPYTILVVDDEPTNLKVLANMIQSLDYTVMAVNNGQEALEVLKVHSIDLIILDVMMPGMSGYDVCKMIRKEYSLTELPVLMLTAAGQLTDVLTSFQIGANDFLQKPVHLEELKARVDSLLLMKQSANDAIKHELSFYYSQITPHFLYNTINSIIGLSYIDDEKTREALTHLAVYFRAKLNFQSHHTFVPLEEELELLDAYLAIEQIRFGDRLQVVYTIDETINVMIPSMTLQPLAENAVQHGITAKEQGGTLWVTISQDDSNVKIVIEDDGVGIPIEKQKQLLSGKNKRVGFTNPLKKLSLVKGARFHLDSEVGKGTKITIYLPISNKR